MTQQITLIKDKILSDNYFTLHNITYDLTRKDGEVIRHKREVYDRGNGAARQHRPPPFTVSPWRSVCCNRRFTRWIIAIPPG